MAGRGKGGKGLRKGELSIHLMLSTRHRMAKNTLRNSMYFSLCILFLLVQNLIFFVCSFKILENVTKSRFARFLQTFSRILKLHTQKTKFYTSANKMPSSNYILLRKVSLLALTPQMKIEIQRENRELFIITQCGISSVTPILHNYVERG